MQSQWHDNGCKGMMTMVVMALRLRFGFVAMA